MPSEFEALRVKPSPLNRQRLELIRQIRRQHEVERVPQMGLTDSVMIATALLKHERVAKTLDENQAMHDIYLSLDAKFDDEVAGTHQPDNLHHAYTQLRKC